MDDQGIFACMDAFTECFSQAEACEGFTRFADDKISDMYDHNFILIAPGVDRRLRERVIREEIALRQQNGDSFCQVYLMPTPQEGEAIERLIRILPVQADVSRYAICVSERPEALKLAGRTDCTVRRVNSHAMAEDIVDIQREGYGQLHGDDFCRRKVLRNAEVYVASGGVDTYICYHDGKAVGKADLLVHGQWAMIEDFDVRPSRQRQGFGTAILQALVREAVLRGANGVFMVTDADDTAKDMYKKIGFAERPGRMSMLMLLREA